VNYRLKIKFLFLLIIAFSLPACRNGHKIIDNGQKKIPQEQMIRLMADMELTESVLKMKQVNISRDSIKLIAAKCYDSLYAFYGVTPEQFKENLKYYQDDIEEFQAMMDSVVVTLTRHKDSVLHPQKPLSKNKNTKKSVKDPGAKR
jgi:hypothetical protein